MPPCSFMWAAEKVVSEADASREEEEGENGLEEEVRRNGWGVGRKAADEKIARPSLSIFDTRECLADSGWRCVLQGFHVPTPPSRLHFRLHFRSKRQQKKCTKKKRCAQR
jgi:hypothetical protein